MTSTRHGGSSIRPGSPQAAYPRTSSAEARIRKARIEDVERMAEIEAACYSTPWSLRSFRSLLDRPRVEVLVAELPKPNALGSPTGPARARVVGHAVLWHLGGEGELANLAVEPASRRKGIASALLNRLLANASSAGVDSVFLEVRESNEAALALYSGRGFRQVGVRRHYYERPREDARVLRLRLDGASSSASRVSGLERS